MNPRLSKLKYRFLDFLDFLETPADHPTLLTQEFEDALRLPKLLPGDTHYYNIGRIKIPNDLDLGDLQRRIKSVLSRIYDHMAFTLLEKWQEHQVYVQVRKELLEEDQDIVPSIGSWDTYLREKYKSALDEIEEVLRNSSLRFQIDVDGFYLWIVPDNVEALLWWLLARLVEGDVTEWSGKLGRCPHCFRFFRKRRHDQIFCSNPHYKAYWDKHHRDR